MYFYKIKDGWEHKYSYVLNIEELQKLKNEIIEKCSVITHQSYTTNDMSNIDCFNIRNLKKTKIDEGKYLIEYDCYEFPNLVYYIVELLQGNMNVIEKIINYSEDIENIFTSFDEKKLLEDQDKLIKELGEYSNEDISKYLELLASNHKKIMNYRINRELNKNQIPASNYCKKVLNCIQIKKVGSRLLRDKLENKKDYVTNETITNNSTKKLTLK